LNVITASCCCALRCRANARAAATAFLIARPFMVMLASITSTTPNFLSPLAVAGVTVSPETREPFSRSST
jgi:hypothetical protein